MAITAKFQADFSSFIEAIDKAEVKLVDMSKGASKVEGTLNRMVDNFSGRKLIQEAGLMTIAIEKAGGISTLTARELEQVGQKANEAADKLKKLGYEVPVGLQKLADETKIATSRFADMKSMVSGLAGALGVGLSIGAVVSFGKEILADVDALKKMHDATGVSLQGLQKFQIAGDDAGNTIQELTGAITKMEDKLVSGDSSAAGALQKLGLSFAELKGLSPENQFIRISDAIRQIKDPAEQVNIAIDLFGKQGASVLPTLKRGFDDLRDGIVGMSDDSIEAIDTLSDTLSAWWRKTKGITAEAVVGLGRMVSEGFNPWTHGANQALREAAALNKTLVEITDKALLAGPQIRKIAPPGLPADLDEIEKNLQKQVTTLNKSGDAAKKAAEEHQRFTDSVHNLTSSAIGAVKGFGPFGASITDISARSGAFREHMEDLASSFNEFHGGITVAGDEMATVTIPMFSKLPDVVAQGTKALEQAAASATVFGSSLKDALLGIPEMLQQAFIGGGGLSGGLKSIALKLGVSFGKDLSAGIKASVEGGGSGANALTGKFAAASGAVTGLGAALSGASGKAAVASAAMAGVTVAAGAIGAGATIGGAVALGAATAGIGIAAVGAYYGLKKLLNDTEKKINPVREAFVQMAGGLQKLNERAHDAGITLDHLLNAKNPQQYEAAINELNAAFQFQNDAMELLTATAQKYGFTLEELGPALQKQNLGKQAEELYQDFKVLTAGGLDHVAILTRMSEGVNTYIKNARAMGIEVPSSMEPMLQQMIELGLLTGDNGEKITDLAGTGVTFSTTMTAGFKSVVEAVEKLANAISGKLGTAIAGIPSDISVGVHFDVDNPEVPQFEPIRMATGGMGRVTKPTLFLAGEAGAEDVAFSGGGKSFASSGGSQTSGAPTFVFVRMDNPDMDDVWEQLPDGIKYNHRGLRTRFNQLVQEAMTT